MDGMLTLREVMDFLELDQPEVEKLVKKGRISAYKIGGTFLRFKKEQVVHLKADLKKKTVSPSHTIGVRLRNYWSFNRIYILSAVLLFLVFYLLIR